MNKNSVKGALTALSMAMLLVACNSNDHDNPQSSNSNNATLKTLTISPSLGKILKAKVVLKNATNNAPIGEQNTGSTGKVTFNIPSSVSTVIAEVQGGNGAQYFDEATGQMVDLPAGSMLRAATTVVANNSEIGVTALTEAAVKRAETLAGAGNSIVPHLNAAKAQIESAFGVTDILKAPTLVGSQQELAALGSSTAEQYALRLATLAKVAQQQLGASETAPALKLAQAIANDLADGDIDGSGNTGALPYDVATFASQYQAQALKLIQDFIASASQNGFDAAKLQALLTFVQSNPLNLNVTPPTIVFALTGFTPVTAQVGAEVTITGTGFNADKTKMSVQFANSVAAEIISATATNVVVKVPQGAVTGKLTVTNTALNQTVTSLAVFVLATSGNSADCGQLPTLTFTDLLPFTGSYPVEIKNGSLDPLSPPTLVKAATLQLTAVNTTANSALVKLNGATANVLSVCQNGDSKNNILVNLDKNNAHVDFNLLNQQKTTNGVDFSNAGEYFSSKETNTGGSGNCVGEVTVFNPTSIQSRKQASEPISDGLFINVLIPPNTPNIMLMWPTVNGATSYRVNRKAAKAGNTDIPLTAFAPNQTGTTYVDTNNIYAGGKYSYEVIANGAACSFPQIDVTVGQEIPQGSTWTTRLSGLNRTLLKHIAAKSDVVIAVGESTQQSAAQKSSDDGLTWSNSPLAPTANTLALNGVATSGTVIVTGGNGALSKTTDGITWTAINLPRPTDMKTNGLFFVGAVEYVNGQFIVVGGYHNSETTFTQSTFIATSADAITWTVKSFALDGFFNKIDITGHGSELLVLHQNQGTQKMLVSHDKGSTWDIRDSTLNGGFGNTITTGADGKYYATGGFPAAQVSADGLTWSTDSPFIDSSCGSELKNVTSMDGLLFALCSTGGIANQSKLMVSVDGRGWFAYGSTIDGIGQAVIKQNGNYVVVGNKNSFQFVSTIPAPVMP
ncbi:MAG: IPT/TIG domain-containing protein [Agitococcus sp.]|nr:IPT/TIG domain-containing protein [Agitococcus sp.]